MVSRYYLAVRTLGVFLITVVAACSAGTARADVVWTEGESPSSVIPANAPVNTASTGSALVLSEGKWLSIDVDASKAEALVPEAGIELHYKVTVSKTADYNLWVHIGYEGARAPTQWQIDSGNWNLIDHGATGIDVQELGVWSPVAWLDLGQQHLSAGDHEITFRVLRAKDSKGKTDSVRFGLDAICLADSPFYPDGPNRPGDDSWMTDADKAAATKTFRVPATIDATRTTMSLQGSWQYAADDEKVALDRLGPTTSAADAASLHWHAIPIPSDRNIALPSQQYVHRYYLRTRLDVPAGLTGHSFVLHIPDFEVIATVFVNGQSVGWSRNCGAAWDCDLTSAIKTGQINELQIALKDPFYALNLPENNGKLTYVPYDFWHYNLVNHLDLPILAAHYTTGLTRVAPSLIVGGGVYTSDVFAKPSVNEKSLGLEITIHNSSISTVEAEVSNSIQPLVGGPVEKSFAPAKATVAAGADMTIHLDEPWANARLWWPDDPQQYNVITRVSLNGKVIDERKTKFGFRQWTWDGPDLKLNGIPWHGRADTFNADIATLKQRGQNMVRVWWADDKTEDFLDECDAKGMCVRRTGTFDGEGSSGFYGLETPGLWDNFRAQMCAFIKAQRNHPSIFIWSLENEIVFINGHVFGQDQLTTREMRKSYDVFKTIDPTRPMMDDGGNALLDESMPVYGGHYMEAPFNSMPEMIYDQPSYAHRETWPITKAKPVLLGESEYLAGDTPAELATVGGEEAAVGPAESKPAKTQILRMLSEGYRWIGFSFHFWTGDEGNFYNAWSPVAVFCRQWDCTFNSGSNVLRNMGIFNDTRFSDPITLSSAITIDGKDVSQHSSTHKVEPGMSEKFDLNLVLPEVSKREEGVWTLTLTRNGRLVFRDVRNISVLPNVGQGLINRESPAVAVFDPKGKVERFIRDSGCRLVAVHDLKHPPTDAKVLVIGNDAIDPQTSTSSQLAAWASDGRVLIVLEQTNPLKFQAIPGEMETGRNHGCITFAEDLTNPVFAGLEQQDLSNWGDDNWTYRDAYNKPSAGGKSLVQCDNRLGNTALVEMQAGKGIMLLSQLLIGEKITNSAVAQRLLINMIRYGSAYKQQYRETTVVADSNPQLEKALKAVGLEFEKPADVLAAISKPGSIAVIDADSRNLSTLAAALPQVQAFTNEGGWIIFNRLTPDGLADYNKLVGVNHLLRPFRAEKVTWALHRNPLTAGLPAVDVVLGTGKKIMWFASPEFPDPNAYSYVVDLDDIAPFSSSSYFGWNNAVNGFTQKDGAWQLIQNLPPDQAVMPIKFPQAEKVEQIIWCSDSNYESCKQIQVEVNGKTYTLDTQPTADEQTFAIDDQPTTTEMTVRITDWTHTGKVSNGKELVGIDNIWIKVARPADFFDRVKPMLNIGAMVEYPHGKGGIILCNVKYQDSEENPENLSKKRTVIATLLRNLHAHFSGGKSVIAGAGLRYTPIDISKSADQFLGEQGWFGDSRHTFDSLPQGKQTMAGVVYDLYSFKTSIVPEAIMLKGPGVPGSLPDQVTGIPVKQKADALFFLQTARIDSRASDNERKEGKKSEMADYVIHYTDGSTAKVPVYAEINVDGYHQMNPTAIPGAQIAWQKQYGATDGYAVAYSMQWNNPHPELEIASIDLVYGPDRRGVPALLAITAATAN